MRKNCIILLDTNICIFRTLAYVKPKILARDILDKVILKIDTLRNNNLACTLVITNTILSELNNHKILFKEINDFCIEKLHHNPNGDYRTLAIFESAKKSIGKFILKHQIIQPFLDFVQNCNINIDEIDRFYLSFPEKLAEITSRKLNGLTFNQRNRRLAERPNNLPEINDRILLAEAIEINKKVDNDVYIFSQDSDFTEFSEEIKKQFGVNILKIDDGIEPE